MMYTQMDIDLDVIAENYKKYLIGFRKRREL